MRSNVKGINYTVVLSQMICVVTNLQTVLGSLNARLDISWERVPYGLHYLGINLLVSSKEFATFIFVQVIIGTYPLWRDRVVCVCLVVAKTQIVRGQRILQIESIVYERIARVNKACTSCILCKVGIGITSNRGDGQTELDCGVVRDSFAASYSGISVYRIAKIDAVLECCNVLRKRSRSCFTQKSIAFDLVREHARLYNLVVVFSNSVTTVHSKSLVGTQGARG